MAVVQAYAASVPLVSGHSDPNFMHPCHVRFFLMYRLSGGTEKLRLSGILRYLSSVSLGISHGLRLGLLFYLTLLVRRFLGSRIGTQGLQLHCT